VDEADAEVGVDRRIGMIHRPGNLDGFLAAGDALLELAHLGETPGQPGERKHREQARSP
jgi:hypothetical protein